MKQINKSGFSIVIALLLTIVMIILVLYILEYIIPYAKNVKGIENSSNSFYQAESAIEEGLYSLKGRSNLTSETQTSFAPNMPVAFRHGTTSSGTKIPAEIDGIQYGNSKYDSTFNTISSGNPIQLEVGMNGYINWNNVRFIFRAPKIEITRKGLDGGTGAIIGWQLTSNIDALNATGSWILANDIISGGFDENMFDGSSTNNEGIKFELGQNLGPLPNSQTFSNFHAMHCQGPGSGCILKISILNELKTKTDLKILPYLEYKIDFGAKEMPLRYTRLKTAGKSYGFQKFLEIRVPQQTTNEAFDFTVFQ